MAENVVDLLVSQIEFADVVLLNKADLASAEHLELAKSTVSRLNPRASVHETVNSNAPMEQLLLTGLFDYEATSSAAGWLQLIQGRDEEDAEEKQKKKKKTNTSTASIGFQNFVYRRRVPFHPKRLFEFLTDNFVVYELSQDDEETLVVYEEEEDDDDEEEEEEEEDIADKDGGVDEENNGVVGGENKVNDAAMADTDTSAAARAAKLEETRAKATKNSRTFGKILRSKGFMWIATRPWGIGEWSQAGVVGKLGCNMPWFAVVPEEAWPEEESARTAIRADFIAEDRNKSTEELDPVTSTGDRRQEIVFIGIKLEKAKITAALDACLITPKERMKQHRWWQKELRRAEAAKATVPDSGDAEADEAAREAAVEALEPIPDPLAADDPFDEWKLAGMEDMEEDGEEGEEVEVDAENAGGLD